MNKDDIVGRIIRLVHDEVVTIAPHANPVQEGRDNASKRTSILETLTTDVTAASPDAFLTLMELLNERNSTPVYPEVRLLQQWQNMSILDAAMDEYYEADLLFTKMRAGVALTQDEALSLSAISDVNAQQPWPASYQRQAVAAPVAAPVEAPVEAPAPSPSMFPASVVTHIAPNTLPPTPPTPVAPPAPPTPATDVTHVLVDVETEVEAPTPSNPVASYQEKRGMIEDVAMTNGISIISGKDWRGQKMPRTEPVLVADFDFSTIDKEGVGRAAYLLVGPESKDDVRIELKSQSTSGSAGDKLPTSLLRLVNAAKSQSYGSAVVGVVGLQFFAPEALTLAREVASKSSRVRLVEGSENFIDVLQQHVTNVKALHAAAAPVLSADDFGYTGP